jgi:hypothetical protein
MPEGDEVRLRTMVYRLRYLRAANRWALAAVRLAKAVECGVLKQMEAYRVLMREPMPDTDLPTLQQRVARVLYYASLRVRVADPQSGLVPYAATGRRGTSRSRYGRCTTPSPTTTKPRPLTPLAHGCAR